MVLDNRDRVTYTKHIRARKALKELIVRWIIRKYFVVKNETGYFGNDEIGRKDKYEAWRFSSKEMALETAGKHRFYGDVVEIELVLCW